MSGQYKNPPTDRVGRLLGGSCDLSVGDTMIEPCHVASYSLVGEPAPVKFMGAGFARLGSGSGGMVEMAGKSGGHRHRNVEAEIANVRAALLGLAEILAGHDHDDPPVGLDAWLDAWSDMFSDKGEHPP